MFINLCEFTECNEEYSEIVLICINTNTHSECLTVTKDSYLLKNVNEAPYSNRKIVLISITGINWNRIPIYLTLNQNMYIISQQSPKFNIILQWNPIRFKAAFTSAIL
jgi:hypothetical protein